MFKVGDKVRYIGPTDYFGIKYGDIVLLTGHDGAHFYTSGTNNHFKQIFLDLDRLEAVAMKTPHKHAELIKAWADGADIQRQDGSESYPIWVDVPVPHWYSEIKYRIKPEPKPDTIVNTIVDVTHPWRHVDIRVQWEGVECPAGYKHNLTGLHVQYVFDGETGECKDVKLI